MKTQMMLNPRSKKGQITIFIIIGITLIIMFGAFLTYRYMENRKIELEQQQVDLFNSNVESVKQYVKDCISIEAYEGLKKMGQQGGYIEVPSEIRYYDTVFWQKDGVNYQPSLEDINDYLTSYINDNLVSCINYTEIQRMGFTLKSGKVNSSATFTSQGVLIKVDYPMKIDNNGRNSEFSEFSEEIDLRFRKIWEMATMINNRISEPDFNMTDPLYGIDKKDFEVNYERTSDNRLTYIIEDKNSYIFGKNDYVLKFAYQRGRSDLVKEMKLQDNYETSPTAFTSTLYSIDRNVRLNIFAGTTFILPDESGMLTVQQLAPFNITGRNVTERLVNNFSMLPNTYKQEKYFLDRTVYQFGPDGTESSKPMRLELYWNEDDTPRKGSMGILTDHGGYWHPVDSNPNYKDKMVWTKTDGFSNYTTVDCGIQNLKARIAIMPWSNILPAWNDVLDYLDPTGGMITGLLGGHEVPLPITLSLAALPEVGLSCVDFTPTCDTLVVIFRIDVGSREEVEDVGSNWFTGEGSLYGEVKERTDVEKKTNKGSCRILPTLDEVITDITTLDLTKITEGDELSKILSYVAIILFDFKRELGLDVLSFDTALAGVDLSATFLQGGHKYQLCAIPVECQGTVCLTVCGAVFP